MLGFEGRDGMRFEWRGVGIMRLVRPLVIAGALATGACSLVVPHFERPHLEVVKVDIEGSQFLQQRFHVHVRVDNPNNRALPIRAISFTMQIAGEDFGYGATAAPFNVPANGQAEFETIVTTDLATTLIKVLPKIKDRSQPIEYRLVGKVETDLAFLSSVPFDQRGSFKLN
jgi:LEA14-like dessication related protein